MKKRIKPIIILLVVLLSAHLLIVMTGNDHLYPTLQNTVFKGRFGPEIDEFPVFANREVKAGAHQPWSKSSRYNEVALSEEELTLHDELKSVAFVVIHQDSVVAEQYWEDYNQDSRSNSFSMAKSLVSIAIGSALKEGLFNRWIKK
ncbi:serine hydrolase [bacterium SCSIO 12741]|nr:serine hydrolase [bacterium SCSIO 12741]